MLERFMTDKQVEKRYAKAGTTFGDAVSYIYMGECFGFKSMHNKWARWEAEYAKRDYRTISLDDFIECGGYGKPLAGLGIKRVSDEKPVFHAEIYREVYLGKIQPTINLRELMKSEPRNPLSIKPPPKPKIQMGSYFLPSTEKTE